MVELTNWQRLGSVIMIEAAFAASVEARLSCGEAPLTRGDFLLTTSAIGSETTLRMYEKRRAFEELLKLLRS
jgi:hypothetical protein